MRLSPKLSQRRNKKVVLLVRKPEIQTPRFICHLYVLEEVLLKQLQRIKGLAVVHRKMHGSVSHLRLQGPETCRLQKASSSCSCVHTFGLWRIVSQKQPWWTLPCDKLKYSDVVNLPVLQHDEADPTGWESLTIAYYCRTTRNKKLIISQEVREEQSSEWETASHKLHLRSSSIYHWHCPLSLPLMAQKIRGLPEGLL